MNEKIDQVKIGVKIGVVMGSQSDWNTMKHACDVLEHFEIESQCRIVSAHRTPQRLYHYAENAAKEGIKVIIAGAGGAAHLPGMLAALTQLPVLAVPIKSESLSGLDSLYSIVQMPRGIPVACFAIGINGAVNAALSSVAILALADEGIAEKLRIYRLQQSAGVAHSPHGK